MMKKENRNIFHKENKKSFALFQTEALNSAKWAHFLDSDSTNWAQTVNGTFLCCCNGKAILQN